LKQAGEDVSALPNVDGFKDLHFGRKFGLHEDVSLIVDFVKQSPHHTRLRRLPASQPTLQTFPSLSIFKSCHLQSTFTEEIYIQHFF
jgi:hypothetical protein